MLLSPGIIFTLFSGQLFSFLNGEHCEEKVILYFSCSSLVSFTSLRSFLFGFFNYLLVVCSLFTTVFFTISVPFLPSFTVYLSAVYSFFSLPPYLSSEEQLPSLLSYWRILRFNCPSFFTYFLLYITCTSFYSLILYFHILVQTFFYLFFYS
jgi:hypothetical protein